MHQTLALLFHVLVISCLREGRVVYRIPLGLKPLPVVLSNRKLGTHALTLSQKTISNTIGYYTSFERLDFKNPYIEKDIIINKGIINGDDDELLIQTFLISQGPNGNMMLNFNTGLDTLPWYTSNRGVFFGNPRQMYKPIPPPMYLKMEQDALDSEDIVLFRIIAGEKCLGLDPVPSADNKSGTTYHPQFNTCELHAEDQQWAVFLQEVVRDRIRYDKHKITRHMFKDHKHYLQSHEWPTLRLLLGNLHNSGKRHLSTRH